MADTTLPGLLQTGDHASLPLAADVGVGTLYSCSTHSLIYQSDGTAWNTWATGGGGAGATELDDLTDVNAAAPTDGQALVWDSTPGEWVPGTVAGSADVGAQVYSATTQTIPGATLTAVTFPSEVFDTNGFHESVTNPTRLTIPSGMSGKYAIWFSAYRASPSGAQQFIVRKNGTTYIPGSDITESSSWLSGSAYADLVAGDYIEVVIYGGGVIGIASATIDNYTTFSIAKLGGGGGGGGGGAIDWGETADIVTQAFADAPAAGALDEVARADHRHGMPAAPGGGGASLPGDAANGEIATYSGGVPTNMALTSAGASFNSTNQWNHANNAFDSNDSTFYWANTGPASAGNLIIDMGVSRTISRIRIIQNSTAGSIILETGPSTSGAWTGVASLPITGSEQTTNFTAASSRYWRVTTTGGGVGEWTVHDLKMFEVTTISLDNIAPAALLTAIGAQPLDADLTAIAALTTSTFGRSLLTQADAAAARTTLGVLAAPTVTDIAASKTWTYGGHQSTQGTGSIVDGSDATWFALYHNSNHTTPYFHVDLADSYRITGWRVVQGSWAQDWSPYTVESSTDNSTWTSRATPTVAGVSTDTGSFDITARYWRIRRVGGSWNDWTVFTFNLYGEVAAYQPIDSDLTAISLLSTTSYGRGLLTTADATALGAGHSHGAAASYDGTTVDDIVIESWVDRADTNGSTGMPIYNVTRNATAGPDGGPSLMTTTSSTPLFLFVRYLSPSTVLKVDMWVKTESGGGSFIRWRTNGVDTNINSDGVATWVHKVFYATTGADGMFALIGVYSVSMADVTVTQLGTRHLFDSWVDRADTNTANGQAMTGCTRNATGGVDGGPSLTTPAAAGPSTITTWTGLRVGATYEIAMTHKATSGGSSRVRVTVQSGTYVVGDDDMGNQWDQVRYRVVVGSDGSLALSSTYTNEIADFRLYDLGIRAAAGALTVTTELGANVGITGSTWYDVLSLALPAGADYNVTGQAHFIMSVATCWIRLRLVNGAGTGLTAASWYMNNAAKEDSMSCFDANVPGGQTIKLQAWADTTGNVTVLDGWGDSMPQTRIIASPAAV